MKLSWCPPVIRSLLLHVLPFMLVQRVSAYQIGLPHQFCPTIPDDVISVCWSSYCCCCCCCCCSCCCCCCRHRRRLSSGLYHFIIWGILRLGLEFAPKPELKCHALSVAHDWIPVFTWISCSFFLLYVTLRSFHKSNHLQCNRTLCYTDRGPLEAAMIA